MAGLKEEEEKRRRQKEEQEKARQEQEAARAAKLKEVDERMAALKAALEVCESEHTDLTAKIDEAKKQISDYEATLKVLDATKKDLHAQIAECEKEKKTLLAGGKKKEEKKEEKVTKEIDYPIFKPEEKTANPAILQKLSNWLKQLKKKYWIHLALLVGLAYVCIYIYDEVPEILIYETCGIISIWGIIQLLQGKKNGMVTLLLNSATFYLCWYLTHPHPPFLLIWDGLRATSLLCCCYTCCTRKTRQVLWHGAR